MNPFTSQSNESIYIKVGNNNYPDSSGHRTALAVEATPNGYDFLWRYTDGRILKWTLDSQGNHQSGQWIRDIPTIELHFQQDFNDDNIIGENIASIMSTDSTIIGSDQDDYLIGNAQDNILQGGLGNDTLTGGEGSDRFIYHSANEGVDTINDFAVGIDSIELGSAFNHSLLSLNHQGNDTILRYENQSLAILKGIDDTNLTVSDILFYT